jgi:hypothetical protein
MLKDKNLLICQSEHHCSNITQQITKKLRKRMCLCWPQSKNFSWQHCMFFFCLFTLCSAHVSGIVIVMSDSPCERIGKWKTCLIFKEGRSLVRI